MKIQVLTLFPDMMTSAVSFGVLGGGIEKGLLSVSVINPRDFTSDKHRSVDDRPFGGGDGMVMLATPLKAALDSLGEQKGKVIYLSPQGRSLDHGLVKELVKEDSLTLICGRYGGIDQRIINSEVDLEISIGDYVLSGGEPAALVLIDALSRQIPGVLGHQDSAQTDSFAEGLLECPQFTRPRDFEAGLVPEILTSGHHEKIQDWKFWVSCLVTLKKRPDLFAEFEKTYVKPSRKAPTLREGLRLFWEQLSSSDRQALGLADWELKL